MAYIELRLSVRYGWFWDHSDSILNHQVWMIWLPYPKTSVVGTIQRIRWSGEITSSLVTQIFYIKVISTKLASEGFKDANAFLSSFEDLRVVWKRPCSILIQGVVEMTKVQELRPRLPLNLTLAGAAIPKWWKANLRHPLITMAGNRQIYVEDWSR